MLVFYEMSAPLVPSNQAAPRSKQPRIATVRSNLRRKIGVGTRSSAACRPRTSSLTLRNQVVDRRGIRAQGRCEVTRLDGSRVFAPASLLIPLPEQSLDIRLFAFLRPTYGEQTRSRVQCLLQRVRLLAERSFHIADEIQLPIDELLRGIDFSRRLRRVPFRVRTFPE